MKSPYFKRALCLILFISLCLIGGPCSFAADPDNRGPNNNPARNLGIASYGLLSPKWECDGLFHAFEKASTLRFAVLYNTFGSDVTCLNRLLKDPRPKVEELILINEPCLRNKRCGEYEFLFGMTVQSFSAKLAARDEDFLIKLHTYFQGARPLIDASVSQCYVSPGLESNLTDPTAIKVLLDETRKVFPQCKIVWNPMKMGSRAESADIWEGHTDNNPYREAPCIANLDGQDITKLDLGAYNNKYAQCELNFLWTFAMNGNTRKGSFVDPRARTNIGVGPLGEFMNAAIGGKVP